MPNDTDPYSDAAMPAQAPAETPSPESEASAPEGEEPHEEESEPARGLLPKSILAGKDFKPGDEIVLKIDAIHDDEVEVSYAPEKKSGGDQKSYGEASEGSDSEMGGMME
jgi:hypothetical protein